MVKPSMATVKRLFAVSRNRCAFPKCPVALVDSLGGTLIGEICHIKAVSPGGPRYDVHQTAAARNAFDNLILMCPTHHAVVDADELSYTVERLNALKVAHAAASASGPEPDDETARRLIATIHSPTLIHGPMIFTQNQTGGQVAHSITNVTHIQGPQPRVIPARAANELVAVLLRHAPESYEIDVPTGNGEAYGLATALDGVLKLGGWTGGSEIYQAFIQPLPSGVIVTTSVAKPPLIALLNWLDALGFGPKGHLEKTATTTQITVGHH